MAVLEFTFLLNLRVLKMLLVNYVIRSDSVDRIPACLDGI